MRAIFILSLFGLCLLATSISAEEIYRYVDEFGNISYSTQAPNPEAVPAKLPEVSRENIDDNIKRLREQSALTCAGHGGIDCTQGPDADGSVICSDGYRDATIPYRFRCNRATLEVTQLNLIDEEQNIITELDSSKPLPKLPAKSALQLGLRNQSDVMAENIKVELRKKDGLTAFSGPESIEPYGIADYILPSTDLAGMRNSQFLDYRVTCANCRSLRNRK